MILFRKHLSSFSQKLLMVSFSMRVRKSSRFLPKDRSTNSCIARILEIVVDDSSGTFLFQIGPLKSSVYIHIISISGSTYIFQIPSKESLQ
jgi:hypothetical protein